MVIVIVPSAWVCLLAKTELTEVIAEEKQYQKNFASTKQCPHCLAFFAAVINF